MASQSFKLCLLLAFLSSILLPISAIRLEERNNLRAIQTDGYYGLIAASESVETTFMEISGFKPNPRNRSVDLAGRRFHIGVVQDKRVIFVRCGVGMVNAAVTTQLLIDHFDINGVVHFGIAGNTNSSLQIGDVIIAKEFVNTGLLDWLNPKGDTPSEAVSTLDIADYNVPEGGSNKLGKLAFSPEEFYAESEGVNGGQKLWFPVSEYYLTVAEKIKGMKLESCVDESSCLNKEPEIVIGLKGSTSNIFVNNAAYRKFLYQTFEVSTADMESSAVVMTCSSKRYPQVVAILGLSNLAGGEGDNSLAAFGPLAATNVAKVVTSFVKELPLILRHAQH